MGWQQLGSEDQFTENKIHSCKVNGVPLIVVATADGLRAYYDQCSHQDVPLSAFGRLENEQIFCLAHGAGFCMKSGEAKCAPATEALKKYPVKIEAGMLWVEMDHD